jgi:hypothetical protein
VQVKPSCSTLSSGQLVPVQRVSHYWNPPEIRAARVNHHLGISVSHAAIITHQAVYAAQQTHLERLVAQDHLDPPVLARSLVVERCKLRFFAKRTLPYGLTYIAVSSSDSMTVVPRETSMIAPRCRTQGCVVVRENIRRPFRRLLLEAASRGHIRRSMHVHGTGAEGPEDQVEDLGEHDASYRSRMALRKL